MKSNLVTKYNYSWAIFLSSFFVSVAADSRAWSKTVRILSSVAFNWAADSFSCRRRLRSIWFSMVRTTAVRWEETVNNQSNGICLNNQILTVVYSLGKRLVQLGKKGGKRAFNGRQHLLSKNIFARFVHCRRCHSRSSLTIRVNYDLVLSQASQKLKRWSFQDWLHSAHLRSNHRLQLFTDEIYSPLLQTVRLVFKLASDSRLQLGHDLNVTVH